MRNAISDFTFWLLPGTKYLDGFLISETAIFNCLIFHDMSDMQCPCFQFFHVKLCHFMEFQLKFIPQTFSASNWRHSLVPDSILEAKNFFSIMSACELMDEHFNLLGLVSEPKGCWRIIWFRVVSDKHVTRRFFS